MISYDKSNLNIPLPEYGTNSNNTSQLQINDVIHTQTNVQIHDDNKAETPLNLKSPDLVNNDVDDNESNYSVQSNKSNRFLTERDSIKKMRDQDIFQEDLKFLNVMESACRATNCDFK